MKDSKVLHRIQGEDCLACEKSATTGVSENSEQQFYQSLKGLISVKINKCGIGNS